MTALRRRAMSAVIVVAVAVGGLVLVAGPASAHNVLLRTDPDDGATVATVPHQVQLTFDQPALALGTALEVLGPDGNDLSSGPPRLVNNTVAETIAANAPAGVYTVRWRVTSADGHPVTGTFTFHASAAGGDPSATPSASPVIGATTGVADAVGTRSHLPLLVVVCVVLLGLVLAAFTYGLHRRDLRQTGDGDR